MRHPRQYRVPAVNVAQLRAAQEFAMAQKALAERRRAQKLATRGGKEPCPKQAQS